MHIANQSIQLFWYSPNLVFFETNFRLLIPINKARNPSRSIDIFCFGAILDFENIRLTSAFPSYNVFKLMAVAYPFSDASQIREVMDFHLQYASV